MPDLSRADLLGSWSLVRYVTHSDWELRALPMGPGPVGQIIYGDDGRMSAILSRTDRAPLSVMPFGHAPAHELVAALLSFFAYGGTWELDGARVRHQCAYCTIPNYVGTEMVRDIARADDAIVLTTERFRTRSGRTTWDELTWVRA